VIVLFGFGIGGGLAVLYVAVLLRRWVRNRWLWALRWRTASEKNSK
jgi:hypothetical protein